MKTILRSDIERALDDLIAHEEGMKFQSLAVILAKARWPDLVASERKNDLGLDAYASTASASDAIGKGLACSITPTLSKIASDVEEARKHLELAEDRARLNDMEDAWVEAVAAVNSQASRDLLLSFVDPELAGLRGPEVKIRRDDVLVSHIVDLAQRDSAVEARLLWLCDQKLMGQRRELLATIIGWLGTSRALSAGLMLIDDALVPPVPWRLGQHIEAAFVERQRVESLSPIVAFVARESNALRLELCRMINADPRRQASAFGLLGATEIWRLEYGRPTGEPRNPLLGSGLPWPPAEPTPAAVAS